MSKGKDISTMFTREENKKKDEASITPRLFRWMVLPEEV